MSPFLEIEDKITGSWSLPKEIADLPDESGIYQTSEGEIEIDMSGISNGRGKVALSGEFLKGQKRTSGGPQFGPTSRIVSIGKHGKGSVSIDSDHRLVITLKSK